MFAYVATLLRDRSAAEDVTAAAFERAYRRQSSFDARRGTARAWLFGIARHAALDELRRRKRTRRAARRPADVASRRPRTSPSAPSTAPPSAPRSPRSRRATAR